MLGTFGRLAANISPKSHPRAPGIAQAPGFSDVLMMFEKRFLLLLHLRVAFLPDIPIDFRQTLSAVERVAVWLFSYRHNAGRSVNGNNSIMT